MSMIGFAGYAGAGKDTAAQALVYHRGYVRRAFADKIREALRRLDPHLGNVRLNYLLAAEGWDKAKQFSEVRQLLQRMGTEVGRQLFGEGFWVRQLDYDICRADLDPKRVVITDVRFPNEVDFIHRAGGYVIWIRRKHHKPVNDHVSEDSILPGHCDFILCNEGDVEDFHLRVLTLWDALHGGDDALCKLALREARGIA